MVTIKVYEVALDRWSREFALDCPGCGARSPVARTALAAQREARRIGWRVVAADLHECAECAARKKEAA